MKFYSPTLCLAGLLRFSRAEAQHKFAHDHGDQTVLANWAGLWPLSNDAKQKNIIFIIADDQDLWMNSTDYMPFLKKHIIEQGTSFQNHFTSTAICCPSRVSLWTGMQPHNTNVTDVDPPFGGYPKFISQGWNEAWLPVWLQEAGYATYYTGKLFNSHNLENYDSPFPAGWSGSDFLLDPGTYSYLNPIYQRNRNTPVQHHNEHTSDLLSRKALGFLRDGIRGDKPFFLAIAPITPHSNIDVNNGNGAPLMTEPIPLPRHQHLFEGLRVPRKENFNPDEPSGVSWIHALPQFNSSQVAYLDHYYRQRLRALQGTDELVDQIVTRLRDAGQLDNTYILYTSDNGFHIGQHRLPPGKECAFEEDIRVPLYMRGPGVAAATVEDTVTTHIDLAPTLLQIAGHDLLPQFDGSPIPLHGSSRSKRHEHVAVEYWGVAIAEGEGGGFGGNGQIVMRNNTYKAVRIIGHGYNLFYSVWCNNEHELYDLTTDPFQMTNLYSTESHVAGSHAKMLLGVETNLVVRRLDTLMMLLKSCKGDTCVDPWRKIHPRGDVRTLTEALNPEFDTFYEEQVRVHFDRCEAGYIIDAEGPQVGYQYSPGVSNWPLWT